jgi:Flp pilus assembly protein TadD
MSALAAGLSACAPQHQTMPMDHQARMKECPAILRMVQSGQQLTADQQSMVQGCQHMDHAMGSGLGRSTRP